MSMHADTLLNSKKTKNIIIILLNDYSESPDLESSDDQQPTE